MISIDMDLPKSCSECRFLYQSRCMAINHNHVIMVYVGDTSKRAEECPLKPIEAPVTASVDLGGEFSAEEEKPAETAKNGYIRKELLFDSNGIRLTSDETFEGVLCEGLRTLARDMKAYLEKGYV